MLSNKRGITSLFLLPLCLDKEEPDMSTLPLSLEYSPGAEGYEREPGSRLSLVRSEPLPPSYPDGFAAIDEIYRASPPGAEDFARYGNFALANATLLDAPDDVIEAKRTLLNPSQIELVPVTIGGEITLQKMAYFRDEPVTDHVGKSIAVPKLIIRDRNNPPYLTDYAEALPLVGEDPRPVWGIKLPAVLGARVGWCVTTAVVVPRAENSHEVDSAEQWIYWGEDLSSMEVVNIIPKEKNTVPYPYSPDPDDTRVHVLGRPHPDITYSLVDDVTKITGDTIHSGINLTRGLMPSNTHCGVNLVKDAGAGHLELDMHEACAEFSPSKMKTLHYRLRRAGFELPSHDNPQGRLQLLPIVAVRDDFPYAEPKPPENDVENYEDIIFGSLGRLGEMIVGLSDRHIGLAKVVRK